MQFNKSPTKKENINIEREFKNLRKELLDLSLRNPLLNFKERNRTLSFTNQRPRDVYKTLVLENKRMHFLSSKESKEGSKALNMIEDKLGFLTPEDKKNLKTDLSKPELEKRLRYIDQQAKTMVQEQGYNILYIAAGFIEWIDRKKPKQKNLAPLILIPVEIERKSVGKNFSLSWTGEDIQNNISLHAKLLENGIELPKFEQTSALEATDIYFDSVKKAIAPIKNWEINTEKVSLGFFSFTKFIMYNDLNPESWADNVDLTTNELIQAIFNPKKNVYDDTFEEDEVDEKLHYKTMYQVLDADSSQIAVIENVKAGHNLVVEGPPGTGKSQTIVNLIAELIAEGKTVLFVSEKMAALEVVKSRLDSVGLGKFVLELHSNKTRRKKFLKNLQKATNVRPSRDLKLDQTLRKLETLRSQLDAYAEVIHKPVANVKLTPFELYGMKESSESYFKKQNRMLPLVRFDNPEEISEKDLDDIILSLENLAELYGTISKNNPWSYCNPKSLLPADLREIEMLIRDSLDSLNEFRYEMSVVNEVYGIKVPDTLEEYRDSITALEILNSDAVNLIDSSILLNREWYNNPERALTLIKLLNEYQKTAHLFDKFTDYLLIADLDVIIRDLEKDSHKKFRLFGGNTHKEELESLYKGPVPDDRQVIKELLEVRKNIKVRQSLQDNEELGYRYFGALWSKKANIKELQKVNSWMNKFTYLVSNGTFGEATIKLLSNDLFHVNINSGIEDYIEKGDIFYDNLTRLESKLNPRSKLIFKKESNEVPFEMWEKQLNKWKGQLSSLHLWSQYSNTKKACLHTQASIFIKTIEKRNIKKDDVKPLVLGNFADSLLNIVFSQNEVLSTFIGELHENRIHDFKDLDRKIINLNRKRIFNKLNSQIPKIYGNTDDEEAKILAGEFTRKSGHLPVRTLLEKAGGTIKKIKPVFMMSPLSIAQYLDPTNPKLQFDVVIFDEASQVKPEDALGAFMRGKTAVVMGDTQQLPPTSFFDQMTDYESGEEVATALDMESILHLCKLSFPVKMLKWHYRSRHESLINISNREFYDNELLVYPSPSHNDPELGLKFHYNPNTAYDRGNSSANYKEAKDVVREIFRHFNKWGDKKSIGVGTFSVAQKNAILEELEIERKAHPEFEPLFSDKRNERFFVKNLETIQGDERDVILISIGYGFDTEGKMSLNFGPLNQDGGERRLNVLVTRAREKCVVFSNFRAHDIHLTANPPFGVKSLKSFLEYAENLQLNQYSENNDDYGDTPFEDAIYDFLVSNGYAVDEKIGCAGFRVDLAIIDEENPGKYILGIECDGRNYASSKVARDRDRLREQVLTGLGWNIYHLWSTDWYRNSDLAQSKLIDYIESTKINSKISEIKSKIREVESIPINKVQSIIIDPVHDDENLSEKTEIDIEDGDFSESLENDTEEDDLSVTSENEDFPETLENDTEEDNDDGIIEETENELNNDFGLENEIDDDIGEYENYEEDYNTSNENETEIEETENNEEYNTVIDDDSIREKVEDYSQSRADNFNNADSEDSEFLIDETSNDNKNFDKTDETRDALINKFLKNFPEDIKDNDNLDKKNTPAKMDKKEKDEKTRQKDDVDSNLKNVDDGFIYNENKNNKSSTKNVANRVYQIFRPNRNKVTKDKENLNRPREKNDIDNDEAINPQGRKANKKAKNNENKKLKENKNINKSKNKEKIIDNSLKENKNINKSISKEEIIDNSLKENKKSAENNQNETEVILSQIDSTIEKDIKLVNKNKDLSEESEDEKNIISDEELNQLLINVDNEENENQNTNDKDSELMKGILTTPRRKNKKQNPTSHHDINEESFEKTRNIEDDDFSIDDEYYDEDEPIIPISAEIREKEKAKQDQSNNKHESDEENSLDSENDKSTYGISDEDDGKNDDSSNNSNNQAQNKQDSQTPAESDDYYYSAVGIENALKKNAMPQQNNSNKTGLMGTLTSIKHGMQYYDYAMKEIENPTEREKIYVIDRVNDNGEEIPDYMEIPQDYEDDQPVERKSIMKTISDFSNVEKEINSLNPELYDEEYFKVDNTQNVDSYDKLEQDNHNPDYYSKEDTIFTSDDYSQEEFIPIEPAHNESRAGDSFYEDNNSEIYSEDTYIPDAEVYPDSSELYSDSQTDVIIPVNSSSANENINYEPSMKDYSDDDFSNITANGQLEEISTDNSQKSFEMDEDELESIINNVGQEYKEREIARIEEANVLSKVDNTRLTPDGTIEDYIKDYVEIQDIAIKNATEIYDETEKLNETVKTIVSIEGPIHADMVIRRLRESCGLSRAGTKFKSTIMDSIKFNENKGYIINEEDFLFTDYDQIIVRRREKPNMDFISDLEVEKAIDLVLSFKKSLKVKELAKQVSRTLGFKSTSKKTSNKITSVVDAMIGKEILINNNDKIEFK